MDTKIKKMRDKLAKHRQKIAELEAQAAEMAQEIKKAEEEQLGYLARSAAGNLLGGMDEVFELLRSLQAKSDNDNFEANKEGKIIDKMYETEETEV